MDRASATGNDGEVCIKWIADRKTSGANPPRDRPFALRSAIVRCTFGIRPAAAKSRADNHDTPRTNARHKTTTAADASPSSGHVVSSLIFA